MGKSKKTWYELQQKMLYDKHQLEVDTYMQLDYDHQKSKMIINKLGHFVTLLNDCAGDLVKINKNKDLNI